MEDTYSQYSRTAENYRRYRPGYPRGLVEWLKAECGLTPGQVVADVGAGTGQMAELFLENGNRVYAIEPNPDMRRAARPFTASRISNPSPATVAHLAEARQIASWSPVDIRRVNSILDRTGRSFRLRGNSQVPRGRHL